MIKIDIYSGFLGAGKTTLIKKLVKEAYVGQKIVLIENEFGEIGIDGGFLKDAGIQITEMNSGCICCSLTGDFRAALKKVADKYSPDRIIIEPSGVGKLSDVAAAVMSTEGVEFELNGLTAIVDAVKCKMYMKNFGEFFDDQVGFAHTIILSRTQSVTDERLEETVALLKEKNVRAAIMTANWDDLDGKDILSVIDGKDALMEELKHMIGEHLEDDDDECDDPDCCCHDHHHEHEHEHHHDHDHEHHHHHETELRTHDNHDGDEHHHHHVHSHHADEVFTSWGTETAKRFSWANISAVLKDFENEAKYGLVIRAKGIVESTDGTWIHFDYTPGEAEVRIGSAAPTGMLCVIGAQLKEEAIKEGFGL